MKLKYGWRRGKEETYCEKGRGDTNLLKGYFVTVIKVAFESLQSFYIYITFVTHYHQL